MSKSTSGPSDTNATQINVSDEDEDDDAECPHCGGRTSGEDVTCADCRRVGRVLNKDMEGRDPDDEEVTA